MVNDNQHRPVLNELVEQLPQPDFVVGQRAVVQPLARRVQGGGVVLALAARQVRQDRMREVRPPLQASLGLAATIGAGCRQPP